MHCLGIDFEDWYHPQLVQPHVKNIKHEPRMYKGLDIIIELLRTTDTSATFFVVGKLLEENPEILDKIILPQIRAISTILNDSTAHSQRDTASFNIGDEFPKILTSFSPSSPTFVSETYPAILSEHIKSDHLNSLFITA